MSADELPQHCIDILAELLLQHAETEELPVTQCSRDSNEANHNHDEQPYCELCRNCYDTPAD